MRRASFGSLSRSGKYRNGQSHPGAIPSRQLIIITIPPSAGFDRPYLPHRSSILTRYYVNPPTNISYPPSVYEYNDNFTKCLDKIKRRHDPTVTTVAQGILDWKRSRNVSSIGTDVQGWLDRFYMSRIGIRFLIGQRESFSLFLVPGWLVGGGCA